MTRYDLILAMGAVIVGGGLVAAIADKFAGGDGTSGVTHPQADEAVPSPGVGPEDTREAFERLVGS